MSGRLDTRSDQRVTIHMAAEIDREKDHEHFMAATKDLSVTGAALDCEHRLEEGEAVRLSLFLVHEGIEDERTPPLVLGARVQWTADGDDGTHTAGVRFEAITDAQRQWLGKVLKVTR